MPARHGLRLLGGFELTADGARVVLPSRRAAALLACLAVDVCTQRATLADRLWPAIDAGAGRRNLRRELARLRDAGLGTLLDAGPDRLAIAAGVESDVSRFLAACDHPDDAEAALSAWGGPLLDGFVLGDAPEFDAWLTSRREALTHRWCRVAAAHAERLEREGALRDALAWHRRLREHDPLQERHHADAMRLHHRLGEGAAALEVFDHCVRALREGAGAAPQPSTVALAQRIRAAEALQPVVARSARPLPVALDAPLIGRSLAAESVRSTRAPVLLVLGEPGVGKSRLVNEVLRAPSTLVLRCEPNARQSALYPLAEALRAALLSPRRAARIASLAPEVRLDAARLVPAIELPASSVDRPADRERFFEALADVVDAAAGPDGVLWIDDLQWADDGTLELMVRVAHRRASGGDRHARVVAAARAPEIDADGLTGPRVRRLERAGLLERLALAPLDGAETRDLLAALAGTSVGPAFAARLQEATGGNPYHVLETLRFLFDADEIRLGSGGRWETRSADSVWAQTGLPLPPSVSAMVVERAELLGSAIRQLTEAAASTRSGFTLAQIRPATALDDWQAVDALDAAIRLGLFVETSAPAPGSGRAPTYRFAHDLAREALARSLRPERRALIHRHLALALVAEEGAPDHIAWHFEEAGDPRAAVPWRLEAAREARRFHAWSAALGHLIRADGATTDIALRARIIEERWDAARCLLALDAMSDAVDDLAGLAACHGRADWRLQALVWATELATLRRQPLSAIEPLRLALAAGEVGRGHPQLVPRAVAALATAMLAVGQVGAAEEVLASVDMHAADLDPGWRALLLCAAGNAARLARHPARAQALLEQGIELLASLDRLEPRLQAQNLLAHVQYQLGDVRLATGTLESTLMEAARSGLTVVLVSVLPNLSTLYAVAGELDRAEALLVRCADALRGNDHAAMQAMLSTHLAELRLARADLGGAMSAAAEGARLYDVHAGGTQNHAPWLLMSLVSDAVGDGPGATRAIDALAASPALAPGPPAAALVWLKRLALRLRSAGPDEAGSIAAELAGRREAPDRAYAATEADYWRAFALLRAGDAPAASRLAESLPAGGEVGLYRGESSVRALQLACAVALGKVEARHLEDARRALVSATPLQALELLQALASAHAQRGEQAAAAAARRRLCDSVERLASSLADTPRLAEGLRSRWLGEQPTAPLRKARRERPRRAARGMARERQPAGTR